MKPRKLRSVLGIALLTVAGVVGCSGQAEETSEACDPAVLDASGDVQAASEEIEVWGLVFATYEGFAAGEPVFVPQGEEIKIVWRATGEGEVSFQAIGPNGTVVTSTWGPDGPRSSNWDTHPGEEWGTGWIFPETGCWSIELRRGDSVARLDVDVRVLAALTADECLADRQPADTAPDEIVDAFGSVPVVGIGGIWTPVPGHDPGSFLVVPEEQDPLLIHLKQPWYRTTEDVLDINLTSPDGEGGGVVELEPASYPPTGFIPSTLSFDTPGCWTVSASHGDDQLSFPVWVPDLPKG